jgi:hypothetical protein
MPWPPQIGLLLARSDSRVSQALRWGLRGLRASLQAALEDVADDPGCEELRGLLSELGSLLEPTGKTCGGAGVRGSGGEEEKEMGRQDSSQLLFLPLSSSPPLPRLLPLARAIAADARFQEMLHQAPLREGSDDEIWNDVQRLLLRVAPELAQEWRQRCLAYAEKSGARPDDVRAAILPLGRDEEIYPGLTGAVQAVGLRSVASAPLDPRVPEPSDPDMRFLAGGTSAYLWFIELDPHLHHALQSVFRFGVAPLAGDQQQRYRAELLRRWERLQSGARTAALGQGPKERLKEHLDLDEALHSLVYQPLADARSWWGCLQSQARDVLFHARDRAIRAGCNVHLQLLGGSFADVNRLAPESLQVDFGVPGEVAACLRVWARIDGEELKGRVLYRSPGEES